MWTKPTWSMPLPQKERLTFIENIEESNKYFFFIRPRRFGKSLLLSTLRAYFEGKKGTVQGAED